MPNTYVPIQNLVSTRLLDPSERPPVPPVKPYSKQSRFFFVSMKLFALFFGNFWLGLCGRKTSKIREQRTLKCVQRLGMVWIRTFQAFAMQGSALSPTFGQPLLNLRDTGSFFKFDQVREIIKTELGHPLEELFDQFETSPFAATTVSQLHRARLAKEQIWTAVKVQQPLAGEIFDIDLKVFKTITWVLRLLSIKRSLRWDELFHELGEIKTRELNYNYEAAALEALSRNLKGQSVYVPGVFRQYCTRRILVMEFVQGAFLSDIITMKSEDPKRLNTWLETNNIDLEKVARNLFHSTLRQVFEDNFFHGDMNTSTIILLRNSKVALIECRNAGSLEVESLNKQKIFLRCLAQKEYVIAAEVYFLLASRLPHVNLTAVKERLVRIWRTWESRVHVKGLPYHQKSLAYMIGKVNQVVYDSYFAPLWSFSRLNCTWVHLDTAMGALAPDMNYIKQLRHYFYLAEKRENLDKFIRLPYRLASVLNVLHHGPKRHDEYAMFKEALLRRQAQVVQGSASKLDAFIAGIFSMISFNLILITGFFFIVFFLRLFRADPETVLGSQLARVAFLVPDMGIGIWLLIFAALGLIFRFVQKQKKQFADYEYGGNNPYGSVEP